MMIHLGHTPDDGFQERESTCSKSVAPCVSGFGSPKGCGSANTPRIGYISGVDSSGSGLRVGLFLSWAHPPDSQDFWM